MIAVVQLLASSQWEELQGPFNGFPLPCIIGGETLSPGNGFFQGLPHPCLNSGDPTRGVATLHGLPTAYFEERDTPTTNGHLQGLPGPRFGAVDGAAMVSEECK
ncbi:unnamed protein product [Calypogeia fissa]